VQVVRARDAERLLQVDLAGGRREQVRAPHDRRDVLCGVVDDHGELVGGDAVRAAHDEITDVRRSEALRPAHTVLELGDHRVVGAHPQRALGAGGAIGGHAVPTGARVDALAGRGDRSLVELAPRARALEQPASRGEDRECRVVVRAPRGLPEDRSVGAEPVALEGGEDAGVRTGNRAGLVQVLDAHEPAAARRARVAAARDRGDERTEVQRSGGRGGETRDDTHGRVIRSELRAEVGGS